MFLAALVVNIHKQEGNHMASHKQAEKQLVSSRSGMLFSRTKWGATEAYNVVDSQNLYAEQRKSDPNSTYFFPLCKSKIQKTNAQWWKSYVWPRVLGDCLEKGTRECHRVIEIICILRAGSYMCIMFIETFQIICLRFVCVEFTSTF